MMPTSTPNVSKRLNPNNWLFQIGTGDRNVTHCISTGCTVYIGNYGQYFHGDMYTLGPYNSSIMIFRFNHSIDQFFKEEPWMRLRYRIEDLGPCNFWRPDIGVLVIPADNVEDLSCSRTTATGN